MVVEFEPKEDFQINGTPFYKKYKYRAIIVDAWTGAKNNDNDIFGMEITGGTLRRVPVAFTRKEFESQCLMVKEYLDNKDSEQ